MSAKRKAFELEDEQAPCEFAASLNSLSSSPFLQTCPGNEVFKTNKRLRTSLPSPLPQYTPLLYNVMINNPSPSIQTDMFNTESSFLPLPTDDDVLQSDFTNYSPIPDSEYTPLNRFNKREMTDTPVHWREPVRKRQRTEIHNQIEGDTGMMNAMLLNGGQRKPIAVESFTPKDVERADVSLARKLKNGEAISVKLCGGLGVESVSEKMLSLSLTKQARALVNVPLSLGGIGNEYALAVVPYIPPEQHVQSILENGKKKQEREMMKEEEEEVRIMEEKEDDMRMDIDENAGERYESNYDYYNVD